MTQLQTKECAMEYVADIKKNGRKNILFSEDFSKFKPSMINGVAFYNDNGLLVPYSSYGQIMPIGEAKKLVEFLDLFITKFNEKESIENEILEILEEQIKYKEPIQKEKINKNGFVYLLIGDNGNYKIGASRNPKRRCQELRLSSCENHNIIHTIQTDDMFKLEKELHNIFNDKRNHSEWFKLDKNDVKFIKGVNNGTSL